MMIRPRATRRRFLKLVTARGAMFAASPLFALNKLNIGIGTYSYHTISVDAMIVQLKLLGIREIEMSRVEFMLLSNPNEDLFSTTREKLDRAGIHCWSYYSATINNNQDIDRAIRFARLLGCSNITGDAPATVLHQIDKKLTQARLTFGLHNHFFPHVKFDYESPEEVWNAISGLSNTMGATADTGQFAQCGYDPAEAILKLAPRLRIVYLKDVKAKGDEENALLGTGIAHLPEVMRELHRMNFTGLVAVEYEKEGNDGADMVKQIAYARRLA
jgi:sugar phosphate isomerase/epimerase